MPTLHVCANVVQKISSVILNVILTARAKINFAAVLYYAYVTCIFHPYITELINCSFSETFFHSSVRLTSHRVVAVKGNDHDAIWQLNVAKTRCGRSNRFLQQPRCESMRNSHRGNSSLSRTRCGCYKTSTTRNFGSWLFRVCHNAFWLFFFFCSLSVFALRS
jgi:hypothetical protein